MKCNVVRDLLPLYFEGLCSEDTKKQLEEHFECCEKCQKLKQNLEAEQDWPEENQGWERAISPLKKVKKKIRRKNILIAICIFFLFLLCAATSILTYGQIHKKGISFEWIYDAVRFRYIGEQFAEGNIDPLYAAISDCWVLQSQESSIVHMVYVDKAEYEEDMKNAILEKYQQYFSGKHLTFQGIEEIEYIEEPGWGGNKTLFICLKFKGDEQIEYYIRLYKNADNGYLVDDYFGEGSLTYVSSEKEEKKEVAGEGRQSEQREIFHTYDSLFSCLTNSLSDADLRIYRFIVLTGGQRALQKDITLVEDGRPDIDIISEEDLENGTEELSEEAAEKYKELMKLEYFLTDVTWNVKSYDRERHLYQYQVNLEFTNRENLDKANVTIDCYRISNKFVLIHGTEKVYGNDLPLEVVWIMEKLYQ